MSLWGNLDNATGNQKPVFANTSNATSNSTINGTAANTDTYYGMVMGISTGEMANVASKPQKPTHSGWVSVKYGTGAVTSIAITDGGAGINANGYLLLTDNSAHGQGTGVNASFTIANSMNTLQNYSTNSAWNTISTITITNGGSGWSNASAINVRTNGSNTRWPNLSVTLNGRAGRVKTEVLVAMGSITGDDPRDNVLFTGI
jgi:hypothetical protein